MPRVLIPYHIRYFAYAPVFFDEQFAGLLHFGVVPETEYRCAEERPEAFFQRKFVGAYPVGQVG